MFNYGYLFKRGVVNSWGGLLLLGEGATFSFCFLQQETREGRVWGGVGGVECSCEVCQDANLVAEQIMAFSRHPSRKVDLNMEGSCTVQGTLI